jgi:hypothetical protein
LTEQILLDYWQGAHMADFDKSKLKTALNEWVKKHNLTIVMFSEKMGYTYTHAWSLLRGRVDFTTEVFGRFVFAYGIDAGQELMKLAGLPDGIQGPEGADRIPVTYVPSRSE